ncbi:MAG: hypothetical protein JXA20_16490 [Spirochaetes bacterium]|nr:hypothetical protein [Spirochaetota bacterium]
MKRTTLLISLCLILGFACSSRQAEQDKDGQTTMVKKAAPRARIAVLDLRGDGIPKAQTMMISELIRTEIINTNKYTVIERSQVDMIFKEHGFGKLGITDDSSAVRVGKLLASQKILIGTVMKLGDSFIITSRIVDVEKGVAEFGAKVSAEEENLLEGVASLVSQLTGVDSGDMAVSSSPRITVKANKRSYKVDEDIVVIFKNFPGTRHDYVSIARENASARDHTVYQYTTGSRDGSITFYRGIRYPGDYEVRAHTEYSSGSYNYTAKYKITIVE